MNIAVLFETSGKVREAFRKKGHNVQSIDILPSDDNSINHIQADINDIMVNDDYFLQTDMIIAHPPCTYLCNSGVRWLYNTDGSKNEARWYKLQSAVSMFDHILRLPVRKICIENPIPHKHGIKRKYDQIIHPWMFGHGESKATCLWMRNLPKLKPTNIVPGREQRLHKLPPSKDRWKIRSETYQGIADAMAEQWG